MNNICVLVSGSGTNLQKIIDDIAAGQMPNIRINKVIADRDCYGLERARLNNIPHEWVMAGPDFHQNLLAAIPQDTHLVVMAGFLSIIKTEFCQQWENKIINIHPSLLPKYGGKGMYGIHVHRAVVANHETETGATVHLVTPGIDEGKIILQAATSILPSDSPDEVAQKVHALEYDLLPKAIVHFFKG
jgi:phosphoribosylglycinamide formyltransferase 1